jgi:hypothetical protein
MAISKISANMIDGSMTSSLVTGTLPAVSGAALLNAGAGIDTETTTDPLLTSNPAGGVGTLWLNKSTGELFNCQVATTDANVWVNIGSGSSDVYSFQGTLEGYVAGGQPVIGQPITNAIQKFAFASNTTGTNLGDLTRTNYLSDGTSSRTHGYSPGGHSVSTIDKFQFATSNNATNHGNIIAVRHSQTSCNNRTDGFIMGGQSFLDTIEKYSFASNTTAAAHGTLSEASNDKIGTSSTTHGYAAGGYSYLLSSDLALRFRTTIDKFAFASNVSSTGHGNLVTQRVHGSGTSSTTDSFVASGANSTGDITSIEKYSFASNTTAANHGDVSNNRDGCASSSHTTHGYSSGGQQNTGPANGAINVIDKFAYSSNVTAADHGDLVQGSYAGSGHQY